MRYDHEILIASLALFFLCLYPFFFPVYFLLFLLLSCPCSPPPPSDCPSLLPSFFLCFFLSSVALKTQKYAKLDSLRSSPTSLFPSSSFSFTPPFLHPFLPSIILAFILSSHPISFLSLLVSLQIIFHTTAGVLLPWIRQYKLRPILLLVPFCVFSVEIWMQALQWNIFPPRYCPYSSRTTTKTTKTTKTWLYWSKTWLRHRICTVLCHFIRFIAESPLCGGPILSLPPPSVCCESPGSVKPSRLCTLKP